VHAKRRSSADPVRAEATFHRHYERLVRVAYLVIPDPPGRQSRLPQVRLAQLRLVRAHRLAHRALPWRSGAPATYPEMLVRVLRRATRTRRHRWPSPITWARPTAVSGGPEHDRLLAVIGELPAAARAGYVLLTAERLPPREAVLLLRGAGWPDAVAQVAAGATERQRIADEEGLSPERQRELITDPATDPTMVRLHAPDPRLVRLARGCRLAMVPLVVVAAVLAGSALTGVVPWRSTSAWGTAPGTGAPVPTEVRRAADDAWIGTARLSLSAWPPRGSRVDDQDLIGTVLAAWHGLASVGAADPAARASAYPPSPDHADPDAAAAGVAVPTDAGVVAVLAGPGAAIEAPVGRAQLIYAGDDPGSAGRGAITVLADATRIAIYHAEGASRVLRIEPAPAAEPHTASAIRISHPGTGARYLLAPWVTRAETRQLATGQWQPVRVGGGITDAIPDTERDCWSGPLLRLGAPEISAGRPFTLADLGSPALTHLTYLPDHADPAMPTREVDAAGGPAVWSGLGCLAGELAGRTPGSVLAWEIWSGRLPQAATDLRLVCLRAELPGAASLVAAVLLAATGPARAVATATDTRVCSPLAPAVVVGWWWESAAGAWHHVAVAGGQVESIEVRIGRRTTRGTRLVVSDPYPDGPVGPVAVRAAGPDGSVPVLG